MNNSKLLKFFQYASLYFIIGKLFKKGNLFFKIFIYVSIFGMVIHGFFTSIYDFFFEKFSGFEISILGGLKDLPLYSFTNILSIMVFVILLILLSIFNLFGMENVLIPLSNFLINLLESFNNLLSIIFEKSLLSNVFSFLLSWKYFYIFFTIVLVVSGLKKLGKFALKVGIILLIIYLLVTYFFLGKVPNPYEDNLEYQSPSYFLSSNTVPIEVMEVVDGDTIKVLINGKKETVRLLYLDTPENTKEIEPYGQEAEDMLFGAINNGKDLGIEYDGVRKDKYGRYLAWLWIDDVLAQEILTKHGYSEKTYDYGDYKYEDLINEAMDYAKDRKLGIYQ